MAEDEKATLYYNREQKAHVTQDCAGNITALSGSNTVTLDKDGKFIVNIPMVMGFSIKNHIDLREYFLEREGGVTTHRFRFFDGGNGILSYDASGKIQTLSITGCQTHITPDGEITVAQREKEPDGAVPN